MREGSPRRPVETVGRLTRSRNWPELDLVAAKYRALLETGKWFAQLPEELKRGLLDEAGLQTLNAGETLFARGDAPSGVYAVLDGAMLISGIAESGKEAMLTLLEPPGWFGEISVFDRQPRTHHAIAEGDALVLHVPQATLDALLSREPRWWRDLGLLVTSKLRLAFLAMEDIALSPTPVRLARRLALMAQGYGEGRHESRAVEVSQEQLASMLSISRQTANQLLKDLEARGLIKLGYGTVEILDLDGLRRLAQI
jgi:CRP-like cAMP-binding protein